MITSALVLLFRDKTNETLVEHGGGHDHKEETEVEEEVDLSQQILNNSDSFGLELNNSTRGNQCFRSKFVVSLARMSGVGTIEQLRSFSQFTASIL